LNYGVPRTGLHDDQIAAGEVGKDDYPVCDFLSVAEKQAHERGGEDGNPRT
jgi:hypothetical protein